MAKKITNKKYLWFYYNTFDFTLIPQTYLYRLWLVSYQNSWILHFDCLRHQNNSINEGRPRQEGQSFGLDQKDWTKKRVEKNQNGGYEAREVRKKSIQSSQWQKRRHRFRNHDRKK